MEEANSVLAKVLAVNSGPIEDQDTSVVAKDRAPNLVAVKDLVPNSVATKGLLSMAMDKTFLEVAKRMVLTRTTARGPVLAKD